MNTPSDTTSTPRDVRKERRSPVRRVLQFRILTLLIVMAVIALPLGFYVNVIAPSRDGVNESLCRSNLYKLHHALLQYDGVEGSLPPSYVCGPDGKPAHSWRVLILPYLDSWGIDGDGIYQAYEFDEPWNGPNNARLPVPVPNSRFACPCGSEQGTTLTSYVVLTGPGALFPNTETVALSDIPDSADPILVMEITNSDIQWAEPRDLPLDSIGRSATSNRLQLSHPHKGYRFITASGKYGTLPPDTSIDEIKRLADPGLPTVNGEQDGTNVKSGLLDH